VNEGWISVDKKSEESQISGKKSINKGEIGKEKSSKLRDYPIGERHVFCDKILTLKEYFAQ